MNGVETQYLLDANTSLAQVLAETTNGQTTTYLSRIGQQTSAGWQYFNNNARHDRMVTLVEQMLELHKQLNAAKTQNDRELYRRQIGATDAQIDALVYELYGLTAEEIEVVEGRSR